MYTGNYKVIWNSGTVEYCCFACANMVNDHPDVADLELDAGSDPCAWCQARAEYE